MCSPPLRWHVWASQGLRHPQHPSAATDSWSGQGGVAGAARRNFLGGNLGPDERCRKNQKALCMISMEMIAAQRSHTLPGCASAAGGGQREERRSWRRLFSPIPGDSFPGLLWRQKRSTTAGKSGPWLQELGDLWGASEESIRKWEDISDLGLDKNYNLLFILPVFSTINNTWLHISLKKKSVALISFQAASWCCRQFYPNFPIVGCLHREKVEDITRGNTDHLEDAVCRRGIVESKGSGEGYLTACHGPPWCTSMYPRGWIN